MADECCGKVAAETGTAALVSNEKSAYLAASAIDRWFEGTRSNTTKSLTIVVASEQQEARMFVDRVELHELVFHVVESRTNVSAVQQLCHTALILTEETAHNKTIRIVGHRHNLRHARHYIEA